MIGLIDLDLQTSTSTTSLIPNLEIMKLAAYYQQEENHFCRLVDLSEDDLTRYDKIFFFSEHSHHADIPVQFLRANNVIFGGTGFTNDIYIPFENSLIDFTAPTLSIYKGFLQSKYNDGVKTQLINRMLDTSYYRMYAGPERLPPPVIKKNKPVIIYDRNIFYPDWENTIEKLSSHKPSSIICIHPIFCHTLTDFFTVRAFQKIARGTEIILDLNIPLSEVHYMFKKYLKYFLADIVPSSKVYIPLGTKCKTSLQYYKNYMYTLTLLYAFWSRQIPIKIKFFEPALGEHNPIINLSHMTEIWANNMLTSTPGKREIPLKQRLERNKKQTDEYKEWEIMLTKFPEIKESHLIEYSWNQIAKGGIWQL